MATINNDFKVKNGLVVGTTATILSTATSTSTITGALTVVGGVGIGGTLQAGGIGVFGKSLYNNGVGVDILSYDPTVHYVSDSNGSDTNDGHWVAAPFRTIKYALTKVQSGDTVYIQPGNYYEDFPITIPQGVSVRGAGLREVTVRATTATNTQSAFLLNGECAISDFTVSGFYKPGYAFKFAPGAKITTRSPYIERFSVITRGSITSSSDPYGFDAADAGNGAYLDAGVLDPTSLEPAMLWNEATFIVPNATGMYMTNGARAELLNGFVYFADKAINAQAGTTGYGGVGKTKLKLSGVTGTFTAGDTITYKDPSGTTLASGTIQSVNGSYVYLSGPVWGFETAGNRTAKTIIAYGDAKQSTAAIKYGTSSAIFDGNGDYLEVLNDADFQLGSGAYTIEAWVNLSATGKTNRIFYKGTSGSSIRFSVSSGNVLQAYHGGTIITGSTVLTTGVWYHVALSHSVAGDLKIFLNGVVEASATGVIANINNTDPVDIGGIPATPTDSLNGYLDDVRVSNNYRYSTTFSVPTSKLTSDANTILLLNMDGGNGTNVFTDSNLGTQNVYSTGAYPATATRIDLADYHQFGAELRCIGSAACFGNTGVIANGTGTDLKLIAFNLSFIGSGKDLSDDSSLVTQANEIIQTNGGIIYYQTVDQNGDFRVGNSFLVNQRTGNVSFGNAQVNLSNLNSLVITDGVHSTSILPTSIETGNLSLSGNTLASLSGNITIDPAGTLTTINSDTNINGNVVVGGTNASVSTTTGALVVNGGVGIGGDIHLGGTLYGSFYGTLSGSATTATNLYAGSSGQVPYQTGFSQTAFTGPGNSGDVLVSKGTAGPQFQNTLTLTSSLYSTGTTANNALYVVGGIGAGWINISNEAWINGAAIVTTATLGTATGSSSFNIQNTGSNAFTVAGGAVIGGNLTIGGNVQFSGTVTSINSNAVDIGSKVIYLSTLSTASSYAFGSGIVIGTDPLNTTSTVTWASLTFDGGIPGNWVISNGLLPNLNNLYDLGSGSFKWATVYANTVTAAKLYDNNNRVITSVTPSAGTAISIDSLTSTGPSASFTINNLGVTSATGSTYIGVSTSTGSISITNLGVTNLNGSTYIGVSANTGTVTLTNLGVTNLNSGSDITLSATTGSITINDVSTLESVTNRGATTNNAITITNNTVSTGTTTGALTVAGGVGIQGSVYAGNMYSNGSLVITQGTLANQGVTSITAGTDTSVSTSTGNVVIWDRSTLQSVTGRGATTNNAITITNSTSATSTNSGALQVVGGVGIGGAVYIANTSYIGTGTILTSVDLQTVTYKATYITNDPTSVPGLVSIAGTSTVYGTYDFGTVTDVQTFNDYNTATNSGYYSIHDATGAPGAITYIGFTNVTDFNRFVLNINYTSSSGHTQDIDLYNWVTQAWDTFTTYSGSLNWFQFIEGVINPAPYISSGTVWSRIYHASSGNTAHRTWIDYAALEKSIQGGQGPRGATGATGPTGPQGLTTTTTSTFIFNNYTDSTGTNSGAVVVYGGVGIGKSLYATQIFDSGNRVVTSVVPTSGLGISLSNIVSTGTSTSFTISNTGVLSLTGTTYLGVSANTGSITITNLGVTNLNSGTDITLSATTGSITINDVSTFQTVTGRGATTNNAISITNATASTGTTTGALTVTGGVGIQGSLYAGNMYSNGNQVLTSGGGGGGYVSSVNAGTDISVNTTTGNVTVSDISTLQSVTGRGASTNNAITITNSTQSLNTTSGALIVTGGGAFGGNIFVGGSAYLTGDLYVDGTQFVVNSTNISSGDKTLTLSTASATAALAANAGLQIGTIASPYISFLFDGVNSWKSGGNIIPSNSWSLGASGTPWTSIYGTSVYDNGNRVVTSVTPTGGTAIGIASLISTGTGASFTINNLGVTSITGTTYLGANASTGSVTLTNLGVTNINGSLNIGVSANTGTVTITNLGTTGTYGSTYIGVSANTGSVTITNLGVTNLNSGTDITLSATTGSVTINSVGTLQSVTGRGATTNNAIRITNTTTSTGTTTGALIVDGGVGVGGSLYATALYSGGQPVLTGGGGGGYVITVNAGTDTAVTTSTGNVIVYSTSTLQSVTNRGATSNNAISLTSTLSVTGQTTLGATTATAFTATSANITGNLTVGGTVQHTGLVLTEGLNVDQIYTTSTVITLNTNWQDTGVDSAELATGSYMVQCTANDSGVGGNEVNTYYTGIMSWYSGGDTENSYDEITLHRAGAASGSGSIFLQVLRTSGGYMKLQIAGTTNNSAPSTYALKFRRMI
jgi:hypothetical protein